MALVDLVKFTADSTGTGAIKTGRAVSGYRGVEVLTDGGVYSYAIQQEADWEYGRGTYLATEDSFVRAPFDSSTGGTAINLQPNASVAIVALAEDLYELAGNTVPVDTQALQAEIARATSVEQFLSTRIVAASLGIATYDTVTAMNADTSKPVGAFAVVAANNTFYRYTSSGWVQDDSIKSALVSFVQPLVDEAKAARDDAQAIVESIGTVTIIRWGVEQSADAAGGGPNFTYIADGPSPDGTFQTIYARSTSTGSRIIQVLTRVGTTNNFNLVAEIPVTVAIGQNAFDVSALKISSNDAYLGMNGATYRDAPGHRGWYVEPKIGSTTTTAIPLNNYDIVLAADIRQVTAFGGTSVTALSQAAYEALVPPEPTALYAASGANRRRLFYGAVLLSSVYIPNLTSVGDSTAATYNGGDAVASFLVNTNSTVIAVPGQTIDQQLGVWNNQSSTAKMAADIVTIQVGYNDCTGMANSDWATTATAAIGRYQNLVNVIRSSSKSTCKIVVIALFSVKQRWIDLYGATNGGFAQQGWAALNDAIKGVGPSPISGVDGRVTGHVALLDDGAGNLAAPYDTGDHIHPNNAGRRIIAHAVDIVLMATGAIV